MPYRAFLAKANGRAVSRTKRAFARLRSQWGRKGKLGKREKGKLIKFTPTPNNARGCLTRTCFNEPQAASIRIMCFSPAVPNAQLEI